MSEHTSKPYSEYKNSGQAWLGQIPKHWDLLPNRALFVEINDRDHPDDQMLSVTINKGVIHQKALLAGTSKKDSSNLDKTAYKLVHPGDIVYNKMRAWQGAVGMSGLRGIVSPAYVVVRPRHPRLRAEFFHHLFRTVGFAKEAERWSYGITSDMWSLRPEHFKLIYSPLPPVLEQIAILRYLNWMSGGIEKAIRAKKRLIGLLNEQKQAIIHQAVTRGLDHNVPLKPSGIPWLGHIPQHWEVIRNMALFSQRVTAGKPGLPILKVSLRTGVTTDDLDQFGRPKRLIADVTKYKLVQCNDIAYNTMRMWQGAVGVAPVDGMVSPAYVVLMPRVGVLPDFYCLVFRTSAYKLEINRVSTGIVSDRNRLYWDSFKQMPNIAVPLHEQKQIVAHIRQEAELLDRAIHSAEREIAFLREYRTRLTADVVTGKLDVREAASRLPDEEVIVPEVSDDGGIDDADKMLEDTEGEEE